MAIDTFFWLHIFAAFVSLFFAFAGICAILLILNSIIRGAPFVPTKTKTVEKMIELLKVRPGEKAADLGSGDGRLVIALAKAGTEAHGYEINPLLVWLARHRVKKEGLKDRAFIHHKSFWKGDYRNFTIIALFGITYIMEDLEKKLEKELPSGARVVSNTFRFPNWKHAQCEDGVFLYKKA